MIANIIGEVVSVKVIYFLKEGKVVEKFTKLTPTHIFPVHFGQYKRGEIIQTSDPEGMFVIEAIREKNIPVTFVLKQVDCHPIHWRGPILRGPGEDCKRKNCPYEGVCPISSLLALAADDVD